MAAGTAVPSPVQQVDEYGTTLRARQRYWELWPPRGLQRLLPRGLLIPPEELDAIAARCDGEDSLGRPCRWSSPKLPFRSGPNGEGVITTWFQSIVRAHEKSTQCVLNQCPQGAPR